MYRKHGFVRFKSILISVFFPIQQFCNSVDSTESNSFPIFLLPRTILILFSSLFYLHLEGWILTDLRPLGNVRLLWLLLVIWKKGGRCLNQISWVEGRAVSRRDIFLLLGMKKGHFLFQSLLAAFVKIPRLCSWWHTSVLLALGQIMSSGQSAPHSESMPPKVKGLRCQWVIEHL